MLFYIEVIVSTNIDKHLIYHSNINIPIGSLVRVQVLSKEYIAIVVRSSQIKPSFVTKPIIDILDKGCYSEAFIKTIEWISEYYFCILGLTLKHFLPSYLATHKNLFFNNEKQNKYDSKDIAPTEVIEKVILELKIKKTLLLTGDNRFAIYPFLIGQILQHSGTILFIIPRIEDIDKISDKLAAFKKNILIYKSEDTNKKKYESWLNVRENTKSLIIIGTKTVFSLPLQTIDLIIIEEEQDDLYQQEQCSPYYNSKNVLLYFANLLNSKVILGTDSPSLCSFYNAMNKNKYGIIELNEGKTTKVEISQCKIHMENKLFTNRSLQEINNFLQRGKQITILQNKLGYFDNLTCKNCGEVYKCKNCSASLTFYKNENIFKCYYCGEVYDNIEKCTKCGYKDFNKNILGIERVTECLQDIFPNKNILQIDSNDFKKKKNKEYILTKIETADIIIGTRAIECLNLKKTCLMVVIDIDRLICDSSFFTNEKIYKMLTSFIKIPQEKIIFQTNNPEHNIFRNINNYRQFCELEIADRKQYGYPPITRLIKIECENKNEDLLDKEVKNIINDIKTIKNVEILGSEQAKIFMVKKKFNIIIWLRIKKSSKNLFEILKKYKMKIISL